VRKSKKALAYIRYADDFVVLCEIYEDALEAKQLLADQLIIRGLQLLEEKTCITNIKDGFDFLGCTLRSYLGFYNIDRRRGEKRETFKILITPSKDALKKYPSKLAKIFKKERGTPAGKLIKEVNPIFRGWSNYYEPFVSLKALEAMDNYLFQLQKRFIIRTHPGQSHMWFNLQYFGTVPSHHKGKWLFRAPENPIIFMLKHRWTAIERHTIVSTGYNYDDP